MCDCMCEGCPYKDLAWTADNYEELKSLVLSRSCPKDSFSNCSYVDAVRETLNVLEDANDGCSSC